MFKESFKVRISCGTCFLNRSREHVWIRVTNSDKFEITCDPEVYSDVSAALEAAEIQPDVQQVTRIASTTVDLDINDAKKVLRLLETLDDHDDVQNVSANFNISEEAMAQLTEQIGIFKTCRNIVLV